MNWRTTITLSAAVLVAAFIVPIGADALTLQPTFQEITLTPGKTTTTAVELENETQESIELTSEVATFSAKDETGEPEFNFDAPETGIVAWTTAESGPFTLEAGATETVIVTFETPLDAEPGGHYVAVFFNQLLEAEEPGQVNIESKLGTLFLATVTGTYAEKGSIAEFKTAGTATSYSEGPVDFTFRYQNTGDVHLKPTGTITVKNMLGGTVATIPVNREGGATLPGSIREYDVASWADLGNGFGKYTVTIDLSAGTVSNSMTLSFWVFTTVGTVIAAAIALVIIVLIIVLLRATTKKKPD
ncbi:MAG: hypothetical protein WC505_00275 [Patescibacteria group bacterium]